MTDLFSSGMIVAMGIAAVQIIKYADKDNTFQRFYPLASFFIGIILGLLFHLPSVLSLMTAFAIAGVYDGWTFGIRGKGYTPDIPQITND